MRQSPETYFGMEAQTSIRSEIPCSMFLHSVNPSIGDKGSNSVDRETVGMLHSGHTKPENVLPAQCKKLFFTTPKNVPSYRLYLMGSTFSTIHINIFYNGFFFSLEITVQFLLHTKQ
jgi:hypothetical protein